MRAAFVPLVLAAYLVSGVAPAAAHAGCGADRTAAADAGALQSAAAPELTFQQLRWHAARGRARPGAALAVDDVQGGQPPAQPQSPAAGRGCARARARAASSNRAFKTLASSTFKTTGMTSSR